MQNQFPRIKNQIPYIPKENSSRGLCVNRVLIPNVYDKRPYVPMFGGGRGISVNRVQLSEKKPHNQVPHMKSSPGQGLQVTRTYDKIPFIASHIQGRGVTMQRSMNDTKIIPHNKIPFIREIWGKGVNAESRVAMYNQIPHIASASGMKVDKQSQSRTIIKAPFPYYGGKTKWADLIWEKFGNPDVYAEPFAGSIAVLLYKEEACRREIICDTNGHVVNFWRAMQSAPEEVAYWGDYPSYHDDLTARHKYLVVWARENSENLQNDPDWYDTKAAGWWAWGQSNWIGGGWCNDKGTIYNKRPYARDIIGGRGITANIQQKDYIVHNKIPYCHPKGGGQGVTTNRQFVDISTDIGTGERLLNWFFAIQQRISKVYVLNRSWESAVTDTVLCAKKPTYEQAILLDPPYVIKNRGKKVLYQSDLHDDHSDSALNSYQWAVENGNRFKIAYCFQKDDFEVPDGWEVFYKGYQGKQTKQTAQSKKDAIMFSPLCPKAEEVEEIENGKLI